MHSIGLFVLEKKTSCALDGNAINDEVQADKRGDQLQLLKVLNKSSSIDYKVIKSKADFIPGSLV